MSQKQYIQTIERELQRINRIIDLKILRGQDYHREARDHKLLLKKVRFVNRQSFWKKFFPTFSKIGFAI